MSELQGHGVCQGTSDFTHEESGVQRGGTTCRLTAPSWLVCAWYVSLQHLSSSVSTHIGGIVTSDKGAEVNLSYPLLENC